MLLGLTTLMCDGVWCSCKNAPNFCTNIDRDDIMS